MPLPPGDKLGPYEIVGAIGAGGMGEVYRARDPRLGRDVAIKTLGIRDPEWRRRFETECRTVSALNHPNILAIYDVGEQDGTPYMVSELVSGKPLTVAENPRQLLDAAVQIADGLAAAHQVGIIHRDLKPQNILITPDGRIKILDFGLAKAITPEVDETVTTPGTLMGTVAYMSPEQARGAAVDARSDQFSFGLLLYEMATGKKAFKGVSTVETLAAIVKEEAEPIARLNPKIPPPVRWIIERCMAKNPRSATPPRPICSRICGWCAKSFLRY